MEGELRKMLEATSGAGYSQDETSPTSLISPLEGELRKMLEATQGGDLGQGEASPTCLIAISAGTKL